MSPDEQVRLETKRPGAAEKWGRSTKRIRIEILVSDDLGAGEKRKQLREHLSGTKLADGFRLLGWDGNPSGVSCSVSVVYIPTGVAT